MDLARNLKIESVGRLPLSEAVCAAPDQSVREAVAQMQKERRGCLLICEDKKLTGIFTERDLLRRILAERRSLATPLRECMTPNPVSVNLQECVGAALRRMEEGGYRHLPVVNGHQEPVGILSVKKIVRYLVEHFPSVVYNQPPCTPKFQNPDGA